MGTWPTVCLVILLPVGPRHLGRLELRRALPLEAVPLSFLDCCCGGMPVSDLLSEAPHVSEKAAAPQGSGVWLGWPPKYAMLLEFHHLFWNYVYFQFNSIINVSSHKKGLKYLQFKLLNTAPPHYTRTILKWGWCHGWCSTPLCGFVKLCPLSHMSRDRSEMWAHIKLPYEGSQVFHTIYPHCLLSSTLLTEMFTLC